MFCFEPVTFGSIDVFCDFWICECIQYRGGRACDFAIAGAILIDPAHPAALGPYPDLLSRLLVPLGVFETEEEALEFLALHAD